MLLRHAKGFTLVELMIAVAVGMVILAGVYVAVNATQRHSASIERKVMAQQDVKPALDIMAVEIGMASYNPTFATGLWRIPTGACATPATAPNQNNRGIQEATANSLTVEMDISGTGNDGNGSLGQANEIIRYNYVTGNNSITRETNCGGDQPFLGDPVAGQKTVKVINSTLGLSVFRYFNGLGQCLLETAESPAGACIGNTQTIRLPAAIPDIRRIEIVLAVEAEYKNVNTGQAKRLIYSTSVIPRNHALR